MLHAENKGKGMRATEILESLRRLRHLRLRGGLQLSASEKVEDARKLKDLDDDGYIEDIATGEYDYTFYVLTKKGNEIAGELFSRKGDEPLGIPAHSPAIPPGKIPKTSLN